MPDATSQPHRLRFGVYELDPAAGELTRNGAPVHLQNQPFKVLACLARRAGQVVSREELKHEIWAGSTFVDFDRGLNFCINRIRRVLGDDAAAPLYIETVPRRGYRFVAPVSVGSQGATRGERRPRWRTSTVAASALLLASAGLQQGPNHAAPQSAVSAGPSLEGVAPAARAAYLRGLYQASRDGGVELLLEAVRLDPGFAAAHEALAEAYLRRVEEGRLPPREGMPKARAAAAAALALSDTASAHLVMAAVALRYEWDFEEAERSLERVLALDPRSTRAHAEYADLLLARGRTAEAIREARRAEELDPLCTLVRGRVAQSLYAARRFGEAADAWRRAAAVDPTLVGPHEKAFHAYRHASRPREALREAAGVLSLLGSHEAATRLLAAPREEQSIAGFLRGTIEYLGRDAESMPALLADRIAVLHAALGEREEALRWLGVAAEERATTLPVTLATDPDLDPLRSDPRFQSLLADLSAS